MFKKNLKDALLGGALTAIAMFIKIVMEDPSIQGVIVAIFFSTLMGIIAILLMLIYFTVDPYFEKILREIWEKKRNHN